MEGEGEEAKLFSEISAAVVAAMIAAAPDLVTSTNSDPHISKTHAPISGPA